MSMVQVEISVKLPDGSSRKLASGSSAADLAQSLSEDTYRKAVGAVINGELKDLYTPLKEGDLVQVINAEDPRSLELLRHSTAHVMAQAVQKLFPQAKIAIGPTIEDGFYYDFEIPDHALSPEDLGENRARNEANSGISSKNRTLSNS